MLANLMQDVRSSLRQLRKTTGFTVTAILTLALGIGANAAIFTLVQAVLLKNLPAVEPSSLVRLGDREDCCNLSLASFESDYTNFSTEGYKTLGDHTPEFAELAAMQAGGADLSVRRAGSASPPQSSTGEFVSGNYFQTFGLQPLQGRMLLPSDDSEGAALIAVISYHLGADRMRVVRMILRSALLQAAIGLGIGIPTALLCVRFVKSQLYNVSGEDGWVMAGAVLALALSTCIAGLIPARRAACTDPMRALRSE